MKLELYHSAASLCSQKVRLCLAEKGLPWTSRHLVLRNFEQLSPEYLALNPDGLVPLLVADGQLVRESTVINEFLDEAFPAHPLRPVNALGRARVREWTLYVTSDPAVAVKVPSFARLVSPAVAGTRTVSEFDAVAARFPQKSTAERWSKALHRGFTEDEVEEGFRRMRAMLDRMERTLADSRWLAGDRYTLADAEITPFVRWHFAVGEGGAVQSRPGVARWYEAVKSRPSYSAAFDWRS